MVISFFCDFFLNYWNCEFERFKRPPQSRNLYATALSICLFVCLFVACKAYCCRRRQLVALHSACMVCRANYCVFYANVKHEIINICTFQHAIAWSGVIMFSLCLSMQTSVPCQPATLASSQHAGRRPTRCPCGQVHSCVNMDSPADG